MKNINRDYLVTVNAKTAEITPPKTMKFFITDVWTSNIFFQLVFNDSNNTLINNYNNNEKASDYTITLRVVKPNEEHKEMSARLLNEDSNFFVADLPKEYTDILGTYECELFIDTEVNGRLERSTTDVFEYIVEESVFSNLDEVIEGNPDYPLLADILATREYVDSAIRNLNTGGNYDIDLSDYAPKANPVFTGSVSLSRKANSAVGTNSAALGQNVTASGYNAHAIGNTTTASGSYSHAEGFVSNASGRGSHAEGWGTIAASEYQHVEGRYNIEDTANKYAHIVGNGIDDEYGIEQSNAHTLDWNGNGWYQGNLYVGGTSQDNANKVLSTADIKFTSDGKLSITINGVTKTFTPD